METQVRKPRIIKHFGLLQIYRRHKRKQDLYFELLPKNGDRIKITWLPKNGGNDNAYIGFEGVVCDIDNVDGTFTLKSDTATLYLFPGSFNYIKL